MIVPQPIRAEILAHCQALAPNQACGLVLFDKSGVARSVEKATNHGAWPYGFQIAAESQFSAFRRAQSEGWSIGGVYHCHTVSTAEPSGRDIERPVPPKMLYLIVSLMFPDTPDIRGFTLINGIPRPVNLDTGIEKELI